MGREAGVLTETSTLDGFNQELLMIEPENES